jgi:hypothetical protein
MTASRSTAAYRIEDANAALYITIPRPRAWALIAVYMLVVAAAAGVMVLGYAANQPICLVPALVVVLAAGAKLLIALFSAELLEVRANEITLRHTVCGIGLRKRFAAYEAGDLHVDPSPAPPRSPEGVWTTDGRRRPYRIEDDWPDGPIALRCDGHRLRLGRDLDPVSAGAIVGAILRRFPQYGRTDDPRPQRVLEPGY